MNPQKIVSLTVSNFMRIKAVHMKFDPAQNLFVIAGENGAGKSSVINAIWSALGGKSAIPERPVRDGESKMSDVIELTDYVVQITQTATGQPSLKVTQKGGNGVPIKSPQAVLDGLVGELSFDPMQFSRMATNKPKEAVEVLKRVAHLDFSFLDQKRQKLYDERTSVNRTLQSSKTRLASMVRDTSAPTDEVVTADLIAELNAAQEHNRMNANAREDRNSICDTIIKYDQQIASVDAEIQKLKEKISELGRNRHELLEGKEQKQNLLSITDEAIALLQDKDESEIKLRISNADATNKQVRHNKVMDDLASDIDVDQNDVDTYTRQIEAIDNQKKLAIASIKLPVTGLAFNDSGVILNNVPWAQANLAEQIKASLAISIGLNPTLRLILIRDGGNDLDRKNLALVSKIAQENNIQVLLERVEGDGAAVIIEDGTVKTS